MKTLIASLSLLLSLYFIPGASAQGRPGLNGAWQLEKDGITHVLLFTNAHYSYTTYSIPQKKFIQTQGGTWSAANGNIQVKLEFHTADKALVGKSNSYPYSFKNGLLTTTVSGAGEGWKKVDNGGGGLNATWRITGRDQNGQMNTIPPSARKTIKIMTGTRFQWAAINTATGEFFGTGGGTYTFTDGRYTETIEFFSRDSSRVGMQLGFEGKVEGKDWHHRGKSSKGDPIYEIWSKED